MKKSKRQRALEIEMEQSLIKKGYEAVSLEFEKECRAKLAEGITKETMRMGVLKKLGVVTNKKETLYDLIRLKYLMNPKNRKT